MNKEDSLLLAARKKSDVGAISPPPEEEFADIDLEKLLLDGLADHLRSGMTDYPLLLAGKSPKKLNLW